MWIEYNLKRCPVCGRLEPADEFEYNLTEQDNICFYCAEDERDAEDKERDAA